MKNFEIAVVAIVLVFCIALLGIAVRGEHWSTRQFGGKEELNLPANKKLVNVTWRNSSLWVLVRPMKSDELPEVYDFIESSNLGVFEGTVHIVEHKGGVSDGT